MANYSVKQLNFTKDGNTYTIAGETYENKSAVSGGTDVSLVTTGDKYNWDNKANNSIATASETGLMSFSDKEKLNGIAAGATANTGTITGITMNGASKGTSGVVNLGTVITGHPGVSAGKYLQTNSSGDAVWGDAPSTSTITSATESWLSSHVSGGQTIAVDTSLSVSGAAADAKKTGFVKTAARSMLASSYLEYVNGYYDKSTGAPVDTLNYFVRSKTPFSAPIGTVFEAKSGYTIAVIYVDGNGNFVDRSGNSSTSNVTRHVVRHSTGITMTIRKAGVTDYLPPENYMDYVTISSIEAGKNYENKMERWKNGIIGTTHVMGIADLVFEPGGIAFATGADSSIYDTRDSVRSNKIFLKQGTHLKIKDNTAYYLAVSLYDNAGTKIGGSYSFERSGGTVKEYTVPYDSIARIVFTRRDSSVELDGDEVFDNMTITLPEVTPDEGKEVFYSARAMSIGGSDQKIYYAEYARSVIFQIKKGCTYTVYMKRANRLVVGLTSTIQYGKVCTVLNNQRDLDGQEMYYTFKNNSDYAYCIVSFYYSADTLLLPENLAATVVKEYKAENNTIYYEPKQLLKGVRDIDVLADLSSYGNINWTSDQIITNIYEPLRSAYPDYVTRRNIGKDASGTYDMWCYIFAHPYYDKTVYIQGGVHAVEVDGYWAVARFCQLLCNNHAEDPALEKLFQTTRFIVVPIVNVWGVSTKPSYSEGSYSSDSTNWYRSTNYNNVNLNRNNNAQNPQKEVANIHALYAEFKNDICLSIDSHSTTAAYWGDYLFVVDGTAHDTAPMLRTNNYLMNKNVKDRATNNVFMGYSSSYPEGYPGTVTPGVQGTFCQYFNATSGKKSCVTEWSDYVFDTTIGTDITITRATESLINQIVQNTLNVV